VRQDREVAMGERRFGAVSVASGPATFTGPNGVTTRSVQIRAVWVDGTRRISGRVVRATGEEILVLAGPVLVCEVPGLAGGPFPCVVHVDGTIEAVRPPAS
jgi:hypothetical protein